MVVQINTDDLESSKGKEIFRRIILMKSWENEIVGLINKYLSSHKSCGKELSDHKSSTIITYSGIFMIHDSNNTMNYSLVKYNDDIVKKEHLNKYISFKGEIPVATEISSKDYKIIFHEIVVDEINLESIIDKYEKSWSLLDWAIVRPMQREEFPVIIWGWKDEIEYVLSLLSRKESKLIEINRIKLVALDVLLKELPKCLKKEENDVTSLFSFK